MSRLAGGGPAARILRLAGGGPAAAHCESSVGMSLSTAAALHRSMSGSPGENIASNLSFGRGSGGGELREGGGGLRGPPASRLKASSSSSVRRSTRARMSTCFLSRAISSWFCWKGLEPLETPYGRST